MSSRPSKHIGLFVWKKAGAYKIDLIRCGGASDYLNIN